MACSSLNRRVRRARNESTTGVRDAQRTQRDRPHGAWVIANAELGLVADPERHTPPRPLRCEPSVPRGYLISAVSVTLTRISISPDTIGVATSCFISARIAVT